MVKRKDSNLCKFPIPGSCYELRLNWVKFKKSDKYNEDLEVNVVMLTYPLNKWLYSHN
jgi:hypothetical protein